MDETDAMAGDEPQWVQRAQDGDEAAFGELVKTYHGKVYSLIYGMVSNTADAEDLAQQTWVRVWRKLGTFKREAKFYTWVYRIAANLCMDHLRRRRRAREESLPESVEPAPAPELARTPSTAAAPDAALRRAEADAEFEAALEALTPEHRLALRLREVDGLSYEEIARVTGSRVGTVMSRLYYARRKLLERLRGET